MVCTYSPPYTAHLEWFVPILAHINYTAHLEKTGTTHAAHTGLEYIREGSVE